MVNTDRPQDTSSAPNASYAGPPQDRVSGMSHTTLSWIPQFLSASTHFTKRILPANALDPAKKQKLGRSGAVRKPRMTGKKGADEELIPNWGRMKPYSMSTLLNKIGSTKIIKFLEDQGADIANEFPDFAMVYNGEKVSRTLAMAMKAQELHQANIKQEGTELQGTVITDDGTPISAPTSRATPYNEARTSSTDRGNPGIDLRDAVGFEARQKSQNVIDPPNEVESHREVQCSHDRGLSKTKHDLRQRSSWESKTSCTQGLE